MTEFKFKVGDRVRIIKGDMNKMGWNSEMDSKVGLDATIKSCNIHTETTYEKIEYYCLNNIGWHWHVSCLELVKRDLNTEIREYCNNVRSIEHIHKLIKKMEKITFPGCVLSKD